MGPIKYPTVVRSASAALAVAAALALPAPMWAQTKPADPAAHAAHVAADAAAATTPKKMPLADQVAELRSKVAKLEAALEEKQMAQGGGATPGKGAMSGMPSGKRPMSKKGAMSGTGQKPGGAGKAAMTDDDMMPMGKGMMDDGMMGMMDMDKGMKGGGMGAPPPGGGMGRGGMGMMMMDDADGMMAMMGMPPAGAGGAMAMPSALPGFPGASHLYHVGGTRFFLDHTEHITLTIPQQAALNGVREKSLLDKAASQRKVDAAEQELWALTAAGEPDAEAIEAKVREVEKVRGDERLDYIRAVGEAAKVLTDDQRQSLLGFQAPQPTPAPGAMPAMPNDAAAADMGDM